MKRIIVGISGASGLPLAIHLLEALKTNPEVETILTVSESAKQTLMLETSISFESLLSKADHYEDVKNIGAAIASGTYPSAGMIIIPCSMKTAAGIANGYSDNLLLRCADVMIKEHRQLILAVRENPLSAIHLENLLKLSRFSNITIMPMMLTYYKKPTTIKEMEDHLIGKLLAQFELSNQPFKPWQPNC